eukprot:403331817
MTDLQQLMKDIQFQQPQSSMNPEKLESERQQLRLLDVTEIIDNLRKLVEILIFMQEKQNLQKLALNNKKGPVQQQRFNGSNSLGESYNQNSRITVGNNNTNGDCIGLMHDDFESQKSTGTSHIGNMLDNSEMNTNRQNTTFKLPREYEELIEKYEKDIRDHIGVQHQMRIFIENFQNQFEESQNTWTKKEQEFEDQIKEIRREKRRLDDLLTIRENELEKIQISKQQNDQSSTVVQELEKKIKHMEKKHEKVLLKMQSDILKYKKRSEQVYNQAQNQDSNPILTQSNERLNPDELLRASQGSGKINGRLSNDESQKINPLNLGTNQSIDSGINKNNSSIMNNTFGMHSTITDFNKPKQQQVTQSLPQVNSMQNMNQIPGVYESVDIFHKTQNFNSKQLNNQQFSTQQQQQMYMQQQQQLFATLSSNDMNKLKQEYKKQRNNRDLSAEKALHQAIQSQTSQLISQTQSNNTNNTKQNLPSQNTTNLQNPKRKPSGSQQQVVDYLPQQQQQQNQSAAPKDEILHKVVQQQSEEIMLLQSKLNEYQSQMMLNQQMLLQQNQSLNHQMTSYSNPQTQLQQQHKRKTSAGRNQNHQMPSHSHHRSNGGGAPGSQSTQSLERRQQSNSNHKRSKTSLNYYPPSSNQEGKIQVQAVVEKLNFDPEKENNQGLDKTTGKQVKFVSTEKGQEQQPNTNNNNSKDRMRRTNSSGGFNQTQTLKQQQDQASMMRTMNEKEIEKTLQALQSKTVDLRQNQAQMTQRLNSKQLTQEDLQTQQPLNSARQVYNYAGTINQQPLPPSQQQQLQQQLMQNNQRQRSNDQRNGIATQSQQISHSKSVDLNNNNRKKRASNIHSYQQSSALNKTGQAYTNTNQNSNFNQSQQIQSSGGHGHSASMSNNPTMLNASYQNQQNQSINYSGATSHRILSAQQQFNNTNTQQIYQQQQQQPVISNLQRIASKDNLNAVKQQASFNQTQQML